MELLVLLVLMFSNLKDECQQMIETFPQRPSIHALADDVRPRQKIVAAFAADAKKEVRYAYGYRKGTNDQVIGEKLTEDRQLRYFTISGSADIQEREWMLVEKYPNGAFIEVCIGQWIWKCGNGQIVVTDGTLPGFVGDFSATTIEEKIISSNPKKVSFSAPAVCTPETCGPGKACGTNASAHHSSHGRQPVRKAGRLFFRVLTFPVRALRGCSCGC